MRILVVGAGAIGGYFGARLAAAGRDVTFLVRPKRAEQLASGLFVRSPKGDVKIAAPKIVTEATLHEPFDLVLLSCKSYDLDSAMASFARAVAPATMVLPLLNGESHIDTLKKRFGAGAVLGGQCQISSTLDAQGHVIHLNEMQLIGFGELDGTRSARIEAVYDNLSGANFEAQLSTHILQDMWEKWMFIATLAGITCLMRAALGDIATAGGTDITLPAGGVLGVRHEHADFFALRLVEHLQQRLALGRLDLLQQVGGVVRRQQPDPGALLVYR